MLAIALLAIPACSVTETDNRESSQGQYLRLAGSTYGLQTLDPALVRDVETAFLARQVFRGLLRLDENLEPVLELAAEMEVSDDGLTYTFTLLDGIIFHDGTPIDAHAVVASFNRTSDPAILPRTGSDLPAAMYLGDVVGIDERLQGQSDSISGISVVDQDTVKFRLKYAVATFPLKLTGLPAAIVDVRQTDVPDWWHNANGSGPFAIDVYLPGQILDLVAFQGFVPGAPRLAGVSVRFGADASQPLNLYESGDLDVTDVPGWALDRIQSDNDPLNSHLVVTEQMSTTFMAFNSALEPYDDPAVRRLLATAFDIERLIEIGYDERVARAHGLIPPGIGGRVWDSETIPYSLGEAERLTDSLADDGPRPVIHEPGGGVSTVLQQTMARDLGIDLTVLDQPWPEFADDLGSREMPAFVLTWVADYPDPENTLTTLLRTGSPDNYVGYSNPEFDELVTTALSETDENERERLYLEAQQLVIDDAIVIPLYHGMSYMLVQPWVRGLHVTEIGILGLETVWIEGESS